MTWPLPSPHTSIDGICATPINTAAVEPSRDSESCRWPEPLPRSRVDAPPARLVAPERLHIEVPFVQIDNSAIPRPSTSTQEDRCISRSLCFLSCQALYEVYRVTMAPQQDSSLGLKDHWKCLLAVTLVSMSPFQYGIDFGIIGGLQAMRGFLEVRICLPSMIRPGSFVT